MMQEKRVTNQQNILSNIKSSQETGVERAHTIRFLMSRFVRRRKGRLNKCH